MVTQKLNTHLCDSFGNQATNSCLTDQNDKHITSQTHQNEHGQLDNSQQQRKSNIKWIKYEKKYKRIKKSKTIRTNQNEMGY